MMFLFSSRIFLLPILHSPIVMLSTVWYDTGHPVITMGRRMPLETLLVLLLAMSYTGMSRGCLAPRWEHMIPPRDWGIM